jgi:hypothetical protein
MSNSIPVGFMEGIQKEQMLKNRFVVDLIQGKVPEEQIRDCVDSLAARIELRILNAELERAEDE